MRFHVSSWPTERGSTG